MKKATFFTPPLDDLLKVPSYNINLLATIVSNLPGCKISVFDAIAYYNKKYGSFSKEALNKPKEFLNEIIEQVEKHAPDILCMSSTVYSLPFISEFAKNYKTRNPETILILGGVAATVIPEELSEKIPAIDYYAVGEGEYLITDMVNSLINNPSALEDKIITDKDRPETVLDDLPYVNYDHLNQNLPALYIESSRGCPYDCSFCSAKSAQKKYKRKSVHRIIEEIKFYKSRYGTKNFIFTDNYTTVDKKWLKEFCRVLIEGKININWECASRTDAVNKEDLHLMRQAGCYKILFGLESKFPQNLNFCNKKTNSADLGFVKNCLDAGIIPKVCLITGFPDDTPSSILETFNYTKFLTQWGAESLITPLTVIPDSVLYREFKQGKINVFLKKEHDAWDQITDLFSRDYKHIQSFTPYLYLVKNNNISDENMEKIINENVKDLTIQNPQSVLPSYRQINEEAEFLVISPAKSKINYANEHVPLYFTSILNRGGIKAKSFHEKISWNQSSGTNIEEICVNYYINLLKRLKTKCLFIYATSFNLAFAIEFARAAKTNDNKLKIVLFGEALRLLSGEIGGIFENDGSGAVLIEDDIKILKDRLEDKKDERIICFNLFGKKYMEEGGPNLLPDYNLMLNFHGKTKFTIEANRGCSHHCKFCSRIIKKKHLQDPSAVVDYISYLTREFGAKEFNFTDSSISADYDWLEGFCKILIKKNLSVRWNALSRIDTVDDGLLKLMKEAGCYILSYGIESLNENTLKFLAKAKNIKEYIDKAEKNIVLTLQNNISVHVSLITGVPAETEGDIKNTAIYAQKLRNSGVTVKVENLYPAPGTTLWHDYKKGKLELVKIKNAKLKNWIRDVNCAPPFFYDKYIDRPEIVLFNWRFKNNNMADDYLEELIYQEFNCFAPNKRAPQKILFQRTEADNAGVFNAEIRMPFPVKEMEIVAAPKSVMPGCNSVNCGVYINGNIEKKFKVNNNLDFSKIRIRFEEPLPCEQRCILLKSDGVDNNLFVRWVDFIGEEIKYSLGRA